MIAKYIKSFCLFYICLLFSVPINAETTVAPAVSELITKAEKLQLWQNNEWINLLHYNKEYGSFVSQVDDKRFFYAADGKTNPQAELIETLKHLFITKENNDQQTQCQFVARTKWLSKHLDIDKSQLPTVHCAEYIEWRQLFDADSITMVFPAYHLGSPSSMFGHTLLRLDNSDPSKTEWLSFAVNFGANINNDDNSLIYAYRGLAGGYPGTFISEPYFKKIQEYNRIEHRDIWEYKLNLSPDETEILVEHLWELKTMNFDYYFFDENCSYRLLELLEVARPGIELTDEFKLTAIPVDTVRSVQQAGMIENIKYRPARASKIQYELKEMPEQQQDLVYLLSEDIDILQSENFNKLSEKEKKQTVSLAYEYLRYKSTKKERDSQVSKRSYQLLQALNSYPAKIKTGTTLATPIPPEDGHKSKRVTTGAGRRLGNNYAELGLKMAFHSLEDDVEGFLQGAQINIFSGKIRAEEGKGLRLYQFDLIDIFSLTPRNRFFKPLSWKVRSGFERQLTKGQDQLVYHLTGGAGGTWEMVKNHQFYALGLARIEINDKLKHSIGPGIGFNSGILSHFKHTTAHLEFSGEQLVNDIYRLRVQYTQNFVISTNHSVKIFAKNQWQNNGTEFSDVNINYQYYF